MLEYGFFNSINGDRVYNADTMSSIFEGLITNGVFYSVGNKMAVQPNSGMTIQIATGRGWFNNRWVVNTTPFLITIGEADVTLNRWAAVCVRVDARESARYVGIYIKYGEYATNPVKPTMIRSDLINEYCLAYVYVGAGARTITAANIEDTRADADLCGWVTGLIDQIDSTTLFAQFSAIFNEWFTNLEDRIDENTEAMLVAAMPQSQSATLTVAGWVASGNSFVQNVTVYGMNTTKSVIVTPAEGSESEYAAAGVKATAQGTNTVTFTASKLPAVAISVKILHMGQ